LSNEGKLNVLVIGAHPDDADFSAGGVAALYARQGHRVKFVSVTNGDAGHHEIGGVELAKRRYAETQAVAKVLGIVEYQVLDNHDGELEPTVANRRQIIKVIREFDPDLIMTHRPNDYHPDHRYTSVLVQDSAYMVTVPNTVSLTPHLRRNPVFVYVADRFRHPYPFSPDVAVDIGDVIKLKYDALHCHTSQVYEWLAYNAGHLDEVPAGDAERRAWLEKSRWWRNSQIVDKHRDLLAKWYGAERAEKIQVAEAFEVCEYGSQPSESDLRRLFPFFPE
jgi:LmbE family N-acetylglucosaminyl deacetylase